MTLPATITPRVPSTSDEYNDETLVDGTPIVLAGGPGDGVWIEQTARAESGDSSNVQADQWRLFAPAKVGFDGGAKVEVDGGVYEVDGPPWRATNPRRREVSHIEANVKRIR